jgi:hypothetical protein
MGNKMSNISNKQNDLLEDKKLPIPYYYSSISFNEIASVLIKKDLYIDIEDKFNIIIFHSLRRISSKNSSA